MCDRVFTVRLKRWQRAVSLQGDEQRAGGAGFHQGGEAFCRLCAEAERDPVAIDRGPGSPRISTALEWSIIQDIATAAAALQRNEIDWLQTPNPDPLGCCADAADITVQVISPTGLIVYMRFNRCSRRSTTRRSAAR